MRTERQSRDQTSKGRTHTGDPAVAQTGRKVVDNKEPCLRILDRLERLIPFELARVQHTRLVLQGALQGNGALAVIEEDGFMRRVWEHEEQDHGDHTGDRSQDEEKGLPIGDDGFWDVSDSVCDEAAGEVCNTIACSVSGVKSRYTRIPRNQAACLLELAAFCRLVYGVIPRRLLISGVEHANNERKTRGNARLPYAQEEPRSHQTSKIIRRSMTHQESAPEEDARADILPQR